MMRFEVQYSTFEYHHDSGSKGALKSQTDVPVERLMHLPFKLTLYLVTGISPSLALSKTTIYGSSIERKILMR